MEGKSFGALEIEAGDYDVIQYTISFDYNYGTVSSTDDGLDLADSASKDVVTEHCILYEFVVCSIVIGIICVFGLAGNVLSFIVLWKHKSDNAAIFLLQCMAVSDFLLLVCSLFIYTLPSFYPYTNVMKVFYETTLIAVYVWPVAMMLHTATIWLTVLVTFNRYNAVCRAVEEFGSATLQTTRWQVIGVIVFSVIYNTPRLFEHNAIPGAATSRPPKNASLSQNESSVDAAAAEEVYVLGDNNIYQIVYSNILYFAVMYIVPLSALAYLNFKLIISLNAIREKAVSSGRRRKEDNITHCVVAIVCVFFVSQTPALLNQIFWATFEFDDRFCGKFHFYYTKLSDVLVVFNSSCNFVVYCLFGRTFRRIFIATVQCRPVEGVRGTRRSNRNQYSQVECTNHVTRARALSNAAPNDARKNSEREGNGEMVVLKHANV